MMSSISEIHSSNTTCRSDTPRYKIHATAFSWHF